MGGDGGSIPTRCELVKEKAEPEKKNKDQDMVGKWQHCALSGHPLVKPIVSCGLGRLYNKEAIINHILDRSTKSHIRKLADVTELKLSDNPSYNIKDHEVHADSYIDHYTAPYVCPIIGLEMSGRYRFIYNWKCGCVISERAVTEISSETCHHCGGVKENNDMIVINGTEDDIAHLYERLNKIKQAKKSKKHSKGSDKTVNQESDHQSSKNKKHLLDNQTANGSNKKVKSSAPSESDNKDKYKDTASYKKLFHKNSEKKNKAHWVTYNPYYN